MDASNSSRQSDDNGVFHSIVTCEPEISRPTNGIILSELSDDVILKILEFLPHDELVKMSRVCTTLSRVSHDWSLWRDVHLNNYCRSMEGTYLNYLQKSTKVLTITVMNSEVQENVNSENVNSVSPKFIKRLEKKCPGLTHLSLCSQIFDSEKIFRKIKLKKLKYLKLEHTAVKNMGSNFLRGFGEFSPDLEEICITFNDWFVPDCLLDLVKLKKITYLSLQGCSRFTGLTFQFIFEDYFPNLQTIDLRLTPLKNIELLNVQGIISLKNIILEKPAHVDDCTLYDLGLTGFYDLTNHSFVEIKIPSPDRGAAPFRFIIQQYKYFRCRIERLTLRNYPRITNEFLKNAAQYIPTIKYIDVSGTSCTLDEVKKFREQKPDIQLVFDIQ